MPSRFIDELPDDHVEVLTPPGLYGGGYGAAATPSSLHEAAANADGYNSPGWRRMQERAGQRGVSQAKEARHMIIDATAVPAYDCDKLEIAFDKAGVKKVVAKFVTAADDIPF